MFGWRWQPPEPLEYVLLVVWLSMLAVIVFLVWRRTEVSVLRDALRRVDERQSLDPRCGGCQYPFLGITLVNNAVTCPEYGDFNRFWPGSQPHAAMAMAGAMGGALAPTTSVSDPTRPNPTRPDPT